ncbi:hypothetical protein Hjap01_03855 [Haloarcula japonica]|jgi:hypothetical protein
MCIYCDAYEEERETESQSPVEDNHSEQKTTSTLSKGAFGQLRSSLADLL